MRLDKPPLDVAPERLFRRLIVTPRPFVALGYRIPGLEDVELHVYALTRSEICGDSDIDELQIAAKSLRVDGELAFSSADELRELKDTVVGGLMRAFTPAFAGICPWLGGSGWLDWLDVLKKGANHASNFTTALSLGNAYDVATVGERIRFIDRPDRFFGMPLGQLTDGQLMAYRACRDIVEEHYKK